MLTPNEFKRVSVRLRNLTRKQRAAEIVLRIRQRTATEAHFELNHAQKMTDRVECKICHATYRLQSFRYWYRHYLTHLCAGDTRETKPQ